MDNMKMTCRHCGKTINSIMADLGVSPLANSYIAPEDYGKKEGIYPLCVYVCNECKLAQISEFETPDQIFSNYAYFSSISISWLEHAREYCLKMINEFALNQHSFVVEIASNDGYLLKNFVKKGIPCVGIDPAVNVTKEAKKVGVETINDFFGERLAKEMAVNEGKADLMIANNVFAHVPDINDFAKGFYELLKDEGIATLEFPHLLKLLMYNQFDTIYHEHFSYLSLISVKRILEKVRLRIFRVEELNTHGGSLRVYICKDECNLYPVEDSVRSILREEIDYGLDRVETYEAFNVRIQSLKREILSFLITEKEKGKRIVGYGAPAKGNTLLNYCGVRTDFLDYTVDQSPYKQNNYLPGVRIPVYCVSKISETKPDYVIILPWNLKEEISEQMKEIRTWGGKFVTLIPKVEVF